MVPVLRDFCFLLAIALSGVTPSALANVYYVAKTGDDTHTCAEAQDVATPKLTIAGALACVGTGAGVGAGHSVIVKEGAYPEYFFKTIPGGLSWDKPFTLMASPGEVVTVNPTTADSRIITMAGVEYVVIEGFRLDSSAASFEAIKLDCLYSSGVLVPGSCSNHIRLKNLEIIDTYGHGIYLPAEASDNEIIRLKIRRCGLRSAPTTTTDGACGLSIAGSRNLVEGCEIHDCSGCGIQVYNPDYKPSQNVIRNNTVYNFTVARGVNGTLTSHFGIGLFSGSGNVAYNNVIANVRGAGITLNYGAIDSKVFNNTLVGMTGTRGIGVSLGDRATNTTIQNNIFWNTEAGPVTDLAVGTLLSHNLCTDMAVCEVTAAPEFIDASVRDFRLDASSPALDVGMPLTDVATDSLGVIRPQGPGYDLGAYERVATDQVTDGGQETGYRIYGLGLGCISGGSVGFVAWLAVALFGYRRTLHAPKKRW